MKIIKSEQVRPFDIDGCLIYSIKDTAHSQLPTPMMAWVFDAVTKKQIKVGVNKNMVRLLKEEHHRGGLIMVWSRSGYEWAANVIRALDLVPYVHLVLSKPIVYFDDTSVECWLRDRVYLYPSELYKE